MLEALELGSSRVLLRPAREGEAVTVGFSSIFSASTFVFPSFPARSLSLSRAVLIAVLILLSFYNTLYVVVTLLQLRYNSGLFCFEKHLSDESLRRSMAVLDAVLSALLSLLFSMFWVCLVLAGRTYVQLYLFFLAWWCRRSAVMLVILFIGAPLTANVEWVKESGVNQVVFIMQYGLFTAVALPLLDFFVLFSSLSRGVSLLCRCFAGTLLAFAFSRRGADFATGPRSCGAPPRPASTSQALLEVVADLFVTYMLIFYTRVAFRRITRPFVPVCDMERGSFVCEKEGLTQTRE